MGDWSRAVEGMGLSAAPACRLAFLALEAFGRDRAQKLVVDAAVDLGAGFLGQIGLDCQFRAVARALEAVGMHFGG